MSFKLIIILLSFLTSCYYTYNKEQFRNFGKNDFCNNEKLKINGYFYTMFEGGRGKDIYFCDENAIRPMMFYGDGTIIVFSRFSSKSDTSIMNDNLNSFEDINKYFQSYLENIVKTENNDFGTYNEWGKWGVNGDSLRILYYVAGSAAVPFPLFDYWLLEYDGKILNDTTFVLEKFINHKTGRTEELNEIYHFQEFYPKPDSTNWTQKL